MFRLTAQSLLTYTAGSPFTALAIVEEQQEDESWVRFGTQLATISWMPGVGGTIPQSVALVNSVLRGYETENYAVPTSITLSLTGITELQIAGTLVALVGRSGRMTNPTSVSYASNMFSINVANLNNTHTLFMARRGLLYVVPNIAHKVILQGHAAVYGRIRSDGAVVKDWTDLQYQNGTTVLTFDEAIQEANLVYETINLVNAYTNANNLNTQFNFQYPPQLINRSTGGLIDANIRAIAGSTTILKNNIDYGIKLLLPDWVMRIFDNSTTNVGKIVQQDVTPSSQTNVCSVALRTQDGWVQWKSGSVPWTNLYEIPAGEGGGNAITNPVLRFTLPLDETTNHLNIELQLSVNEDLSEPILELDTKVSITGWKVFNGLTWEALSVDGVLAGYAGQQVVYDIPQDLLTPGTLYYGRYRVINDDDVYSDYRGLHVTG